MIPVFLPTPEYRVVTQAAPGQVQRLEALHLLVRRVLPLVLFAGLGLLASSLAAAAVPLAILAV